VLNPRTTDTGRLYRPPRHPYTGRGRSHGSCFMPNRESRFEIRAIAALKPPRQHGAYPSTHPDQAPARSIERFGFVAPIVISGSGEIVAGEARWLAAKSESTEQACRSCIAELYSAAQVEAYRIADHRLAEDATWDDAILGTIIRNWIWSCRSKSSRLWAFSTPRSTSCSRSASRLQARAPKTTRPRLRP